MDLWARYHYKSTIVTFAGSIQEIVRDPDITIGIFAATKMIAKPFLGQIMEELESNTWLQTIYPDVLWSKPRQEAPSWSAQDGITVKRSSNPKEATVEAHGLVAGMPTGKHYRLLIYDDLVVQDMVSNPEMISKVTQRWELSDNLGVGAGTRKWHVGTRYSYGDTYGQVMDRGILTPRLFPATDNGKLDGEPVFLDAAHWEKVKLTQQSTIAAQMLQNPLAGSETMFPVKHFRPFEIRPATLHVAILGDPSKGRSATSDRTAIAVVGLDAAGNKFLIDGYCHRMTLSQRWQALRDLWKKWTRTPGVQQVKVGWESYGLQVDTEHFQDAMQREGVYFPIEELNWTRDGGESKEHRVGRLEPDHREGRLWLPLRVYDRLGKREALWRHDADRTRILYPPAIGPTKLEQEFVANGAGFRVQRPIRQKDQDGEVYDVTVRLIDEMRLFPFAPYDDLVDALSRIYDIDLKPPSPSEKERYDRFNSELVE